MHSSPLSVYTTVSNRPWALRPTSTHRGSPCALTSSSAKAIGSRSDVTASSKLTPCFAKFDSALSGSSSIYMCIEYVREISPMQPLTNLWISQLLSTRWGPSQIYGRLTGGTGHSTALVCRRLRGPQTLGTCGPNSHSKAGTQCSCGLRTKTERRPLW
jgi:hypothetical protein